MIGPFTTLSITREVARIIGVQNLKLDGFQLRENLHQSLSVKLCWWETKQVCILMSKVHLEGWNFGSCFFFGVPKCQALIIVGLSECCWWKKFSTEMTLLPYEIIWNHMKSCQLSSRKFFSVNLGLGIDPHLLLRRAKFCGLALGSQLCATKNANPLELGTYRATSFTVYFWKDSKFLVL